MDEAVVCECGSKTFWWFGKHLRCPNCHAELKFSKGKFWQRWFNLETHEYQNRWHVMSNPYGVRD